MKVIMHTIHQYDVSIFLWVTERKTRHLLVRLARLVSRMADGPLYGMLALALVYSGQEPQLTLLKCLLLGFVMERPLYWVMKNVCRRNRPQAALNIPSFVIPSDRFSFPSGHTSAAFLVTTLVSAFYPGLGPLLFPWAVMVGMARVILGVHFPTDTLIGALMGSGLAVLSLECLLK
ncbi:MAG: phosphatase PAP2 family protein [Methylococcus sp.]